ncbi:hypothetical protein NPIL_118191 [Nephila pilipes]|uniref:Uncharacterized protein n=1 Tax=Nephila pilipes TaxID=299642 RepID=A0A8X6UE20_NEPPI|nr:hypothetical protein NPIL_118191 [Nephila pilipes]
MEEESTGYGENSSSLRSAETVKTDIKLRNLKNASHRVYSSKCSQKYLNPQFGHCIMEMQNLYDSFNHNIANLRIFLLQYRFHLLSLLDEIVVNSKFPNNIKTHFSKTDTSYGISENDRVEDMEKANMELKAFARDIVTFIRNTLWVKQFLEDFEDFKNDNEAINEHLFAYVSNIFKQYYKMMD